MKKLLIAACLAGCATGPAPYEPSAPRQWVKKPAVEELSKYDYSSENGLFSASKRQFGKYEINIISNVPEFRNPSLLDLDEGRMYFGEFKNAFRRFEEDDLMITWKSVVMGAVAGEETQAVIALVNSEGAARFPEFDELLVELSGKKPTGFKIAQTEYLDRNNRMNRFSNIMTSYFIPEDGIGKGEWGQLGIGITFDAVSERREAGIVLIPERIEALEEKIGKSMSISTTSSLAEFVKGTQLQEVPATYEIPGYGKIVYDGNKVAVLAAQYSEAFETPDFKHGRVWMVDKSGAIIIIPEGLDQEGQEVLIVKMKKPKVYVERTFLRPKKEQQFDPEIVKDVPRILFVLDESLKTLRAIGEKADSREEKEEVLRSLENEGFGKDAIDTVRKEWNLD